MKDFKQNSRRQFFKDRSLSLSLIQYVMIGLIIIMIGVLAFTFANLIDAFLYFSLK